jgi:hypothetical protein
MEELFAIEKPYCSRAPQAEEHLRRNMGLRILFCRTGSQTGPQETRKSVDLCRFQPPAMALRKYMISSTYW